MVHTEDEIRRDVQEEIRRRIRGELRCDKFSRILYSTDASIYQIEPLGVVIPKSIEDILAVCEVALKYKIPILPRGSGTSLAGQTVGRALIIDFSRHLDQILEINNEEMWARVQPGVVLDHLNAVLAPKKLLFGPDTATSNRATIGGMVGNNSAGARSIIYKKTQENILGLRAVLADGREHLLSKLTPEEVEVRCRIDAFEKKILTTVKNLATNHRDEILRRYPKIMRRVSGYNLDSFIDATQTNLADLLVGSEGTLGIVTDAKVKLVPKPAHRILAIGHFHSLMAALEAVEHILPHQPSAVELLDEMILQLTKATLEFRRKMTFVQDEPKALLIVEFQGDDEGELLRRLEKLKDDMRGRHIGFAWLDALTSEAQANVWAVRKAGLGLLAGVPGDRKPIAFVEDTAVPVNQMPQFIDEFTRLIREHGTEAGIYAHASVGCLHIKPLINLKLRSEVIKMRSLAEAVLELVLKFNGAMSGEHGDGLARSEWHRRFFGDEIYGAFKEIKKVFDPDNLFNPGKIVDAPAMHENLRFGEAYHAHKPATVFHYQQEGGFAAAVELCNGNGACRKLTDGTMCPSFMVTREEEHSTRGRANLLRAAINGNLPFDSLSEKRLYDALDLCLACKGCKGECPTNVDMAKLKYEFLNNYHRTHGVPLRSLLFGHIAKLNQWVAPFAKAMNSLLQASPVKWALEKTMGIDCRRQMPLYAASTFVKWFEEHQRARKNSGQGSSHESSKKVILFVDTFTNYHQPEVGRAAVTVLERLGFSVELVQHKCCGRPHLSKGLLNDARRLAEENVQLLYPHACAGVPIVGLEPSCLLTLRDEYLDLVPGPEAEAVAAKSFLWEEFLMRDEIYDDLKQLLRPIAQRSSPDALRSSRFAPCHLLLHGHCHQKAYVGIEKMLTLLRMIPNAEVRPINSGCCGMAGAFGFEKEHYDISMAIGEQRLFPAIRDVSDEWIIVAPGISCRQQIAQGTGKMVLHPAEVMARQLPEVKSDLRTIILENSKKS